jgi:2-dehydro-3-deoxyphosphogluconate aldolase/(4S)-4-hydroxy-2-oxoglutarate aldolase
MTATRMAADAALAALGRARVLPVVRTAEARSALEQGERILDAGFGVLELTATIPGWEGALAEARRRWPDVLLGAGTLTTREQAELALRAGADFLVSPWAAPAVREVTGRNGLLFLEGAFTPGELAAATARGPAKLFPAHAGGPAYLRTVLAVLPGAAVVPTGGIELDAIADYLAAGALAVGVNGGRLVGSEPAAVLAAVRRGG